MVSHLSWVSTISIKVTEGWRKLGFPQVEQYPEPVSAF